MNQHTGWFNVYERFRVALSTCVAGDIAALQSRKAMDG
jgi:hypothetical protein